VNLIVASNNTGKIRELRSLLQPISVYSPNDLNLKLDVEEIGDSFFENAQLKAKAFAQETGMTALADDSGLEVEALHGRPGIHSARFGPPDLDDNGRCMFLLKNLKNFPSVKDRKARFCCAMVAFTPNGDQCESVGYCEGHITTSMTGNEGFGYDPVFFVTSHRCTMAELSKTTKNSISHRGAALRIIRPKLMRLMRQLER